MNWTTSGGLCMAGVRFEDVAKVYSDGTRAVTGLDLEISDGEFTVLVGPSGCGKTTALRMVAGLEAISEGVV
ncbi:MAG: ATP-binding cassette domain-containing protein, partial [Candidatus Binatia bacterium]